MDTVQTTSYRRRRWQGRRSPSAWFRRAASLVFVLIYLLSGSQLVPTLASTQADAGYRDFSFGTSGVSAPTGEKPESKLWFNDGSWWGSLYNDAAQDYHIYRLDLATQDWVDTGTVLDDRPGSLADALWDGQKLYLVSHIFTTTGAPTTTQSQWGRLYRFSYNASNHTYSLDSGFPVTVTKGKSETLTIDKDSTGTLWVTYVESNKVMVSHSNGSDTSWVNPYSLPAASTTNLNSDDISAVVAFKVTPKNPPGNSTSQNIGVMWSNQTDKKMYFAVHVDGTPDQSWQSVVVYSTSADDHINLKSLVADPAGNVFAVVKTSLTTANAPLVVVLACVSGQCLTVGAWSPRTFGTVADSHTRPILLIDTDHRELYVFATSGQSGGTIYYKKSSIDNVQFPTGKGTPFIQSASDANINNATSTKQNVNGATGIVVLASDKQTNYYLHNYMSLGGGGGGGGGGTGPVISSFTPSSGPVGAEVTMAGSSFNTASQVTFNGTPASFIIDSDSQIRATVPAGATSGKISVTNPYGTATSASDFTVTSSGGGGGGGSTITLAPTDDAQVKMDSPTKNFGSDPALRLKSTASTFNSYLKFNVSGISGTVQSAKLRLYVTDASDVGGSIFSVDNNYLGSSTPWAEGGLNWNNAPAIGGSPLSSLGSVALNATVEFDVTAAITADGVYSFGMNSTSTNSVYYSSKEGANPPQLVITLAP